MRYAPNTLVMWLNTPDALHGVTPRAVTEAPRRYVNFVADCYGLATDRLFEVPRTPVAAVKEWVQHALAQAAPAPRPVAGVSARGMGTGGIAPGNPEATGHLR